MLTLLAVVMAAVGPRGERPVVEQEARTRLSVGGSVVHLSGFLAPTGAADAEGAARQFLGRNADAFALDGAQVLERVGGSQSAIRFRRTLDGWPIFNGDLVVGVDDERRVFVVNARPVARGVSGNRVLDAAAAERAALQGLVAAGPATVAEGWLSLPGGLRPVFRVEAVTISPPADLRAYVDAETGRVLFATDLRAYGSAPGSVYELSPAETSASVCPLSGGAHSLCAKPIQVTFPNLVTGADLSGTQTTVYNCLGSDPPARAADVPGPCRPVQASGGGFLFPPDSTFSSTTDDFAAAMAYYHLDRHVSFFRRIDPTLPPARRAISGSMPAMVNAYQGGKPLFNAFYSSLLDGMVFGQFTNVDFAYDATVMYHEFTHGVVAAFGGMDPDWDAAGGFDEPGAVNEGTADSMAVSETGRSAVGAFIGTALQPPAAALRDMADPSLKRSCRGDGTVTGQFGAQSINGLDGEVHDDGEIWNGFFWELYAGLRNAGVKGCGGGCEAATAIQYRALQLAGGTGPSLRSYAGTMKAAASALFPSQPKVADYVGCVAQRRGFDLCDRTVPLYGGETKVQYVRLRFSPFQISVAVTGAEGIVRICSHFGGATTVHGRKGAPVELTGVDPKTGVASFKDDGSLDFAKACAGGTFGVRLETGTWFLLFDSPAAFLGNSQTRGFDLYTIQADTAGIAARPAVTAAPPCAISLAPLEFSREAAATTPPKGRLELSATGGTGQYTWALVTNASGGAIDAATGTYTAGAKGSVTDVVQVKDTAGATVTHDVSVTAGVSIAPAGAKLKSKQTQTFTASGGSGSGFVWTLTGNNSGATLDASGAYTAGGKGGVSDTVQVADSLGNLASATIDVASGGGCATAGGAEILLLLPFALLLRRRRS